MKDGVYFVTRHFPKMSVWACGGIETGFQLKEIRDLGAVAEQILTVNGYRWKAAKTMCKEFLTYWD